MMYGSYASDGMVQDPAHRRHGQSLPGPPPLPPVPLSMPSSAAATAGGGGGGATQPDFAGFDGESKLLFPSLALSLSLFLSLVLSIAHYPSSIFIRMLPWRLRNGALSPWLCFLTTFFQASMEVALVLPLRFTVSSILNCLPFSKSPVLFIGRRPRKPIHRRTVDHTSPAIRHIQVSPKRLVLSCIAVVHLRAIGCS
jgi:preprotein translocase subunit Sec61beta